MTTIKSGLEMIAEELRRQREEEGFSVERDASLYFDNELVRAAVCYALPGDDICRELHSGFSFAPIGTKVWPWDKSWWKPASRIDDLTKAGALIAAELDRRQYLAENLLEEKFDRLTRI